MAMDAGLHSKVRGTARSGRDVIAVEVSNQPATPSSSPQSREHDVWVAGKTGAPRRGPLRGHSPAGSAARGRASVFCLGRKKGRERKEERRKAVPGGHAHTRRPQAPAARALRLRSGAQAPGQVNFEGGKPQLQQGAGSKACAQVHANMASRTQHQTSCTGYQEENKSATQKLAPPPCRSPASSATAVTRKAVERLKPSVKHRQIKTEK